MRRSGRTDADGLPILTRLSFRLIERGGRKSGKERHALAHVMSSSAILETMKTKKLWRKEAIDSSSILSSTSDKRSKNEKSIDFQRERTLSLGRTDGQLHTDGHVVIRPAVVEAQWSEREGGRRRRRLL